MTTSATLVTIIPPSTTIKRSRRRYPCVLEVSRSGHVRSESVTPFAALGGGRRGRVRLDRLAGFDALLPLVDPHRRLPSPSPRSRGGANQMQPQSSETSDRSKSPPSIEGGRGKHRPRSSPMRSDSRPPCRFQANAAKRAALSDIETKTLLPGGSTPSSQLAVDLWEIDEG
jgi:hypothetical protein